MSYIPDEESLEPGWSWGQNVVAALDNGKWAQHNC